MSPLNCSVFALMLLVVVAVLSSSSEARSVRQVRSPVSARAQKRSYAIGSLFEDPRKFSRLSSVFREMLPPVSSTSINAMDWNNMDDINIGDLLKQAGIN